MIPVVVFYLNGIEFELPIAGDCAPDVLDLIGHADGLDAISIHTGDGESAVFTVAKLLPSAE